MKKSNTSQIITTIITIFIITFCIGCQEPITESEIKMESLIDKTNDELDNCGFEKAQAIEIPEIRIESCHNYIEDIKCIDEELKFPAGCVIVEEF